MKKKIVVIGAGLAGTLVSNELSKKYDVILLEQGTEKKIQYPKIKYINKSLGQVKTFCAGLGGTTNLWHNGLIPMQETDISDAYFKNVLSASSKYRDEAAFRLHWKDGSFEKMYTEILDDTTVMSEQLGVFKDGIDCLFYPQKYIPLKPNKKIKTFFSVRDIQFNVNKERVHNIYFTTKTGSYRLNIDELIISAGTLGTPQLVKKLYKQIGYSTDSIGKGFADHPMGFVGKVKIKKEFNEIIKKLSLSDYGNYITRTAIRLKSDCGKYTSAVFFRPALSMKNNLSLYKYKSGLGASSGKDRIKYLFSYKLFHKDVLAEIVSHLFNITIPGRVYNIMFINDQKRGRNKVTYDESSIVLDWQISEDEISIYNKMLKKFEKMLMPISDDLEINTNISEKWLWSGAHHSGTISMGPKEDDILDGNLQIKKLGNVYVCDGSVIQEHSYANTGLTIGQLALRLADKL